VFGESSLEVGSVVCIDSVQEEGVRILVMWDGQVTGGHFVELDLSFGQANKLKDELVVISLNHGMEITDCTMCRVQLLDASDYGIVNQHIDANVLDTCKLVSRDLVIPIILSQHVKVLVKVLYLEPNNKIGRLTKWTEMQFHHSLDETPRKTSDSNDDFEIANQIPLISRSLGIDGKSRFVPGALLITGDRGSGKSHFLKSILSDYKKFHSELFNCKQLRGKRPESIKKILYDLLANALENQPSILALDDIDSIVHCDPKHNDEKGQEVLYRKRLVDVVCNLFKQLERSEHRCGNRIMIIASCQSIGALDERLSKPRGRRFFNQIIKIRQPDLDKRISILRDILAERKNNVLSKLDSDQLRFVAKKCEFYFPGDIRRLVERSVINACSRVTLNFDSEPISIVMEDVLKSLEGYVPANLRGVALQTKTVRTFEHVGGMNKIKEVLTKTILLQVKYPKLFERCPIRTQNSILLYGPPGCGKTLIAEALTSQDCIQSIYVRGPELLSKYIGASEGAVRTLFKQAEMAKPCVIFFDEFESLVSKRGSDSTGVTDRIVNQFLTLMDGVEELSRGVFILAASSRPDMIDPAILRPGRLDKHVYCPMPDRNDRHDILKVLGKNMDIVDFESSLYEWSERLDGFTGADIQSFLYSAQLKALHDIIGPYESSRDMNFGNKSSKSDFSIKVEQTHLERSFNEMISDIKSRNRDLSNRYPTSIRKINQLASTRATLA